MSLRRIRCSKDLPNKYIQCIVCRKTYNEQQIIGFCCIYCHMPYKSMAQFLYENSLPNL